MSINSYQREIYASHLAHGERRHHKYLYKEGDRYIYPDDVKTAERKADRKNLYVRQKSTGKAIADSKRAEERRRRAENVGAYDLEDQIKNTKARKEAKKYQKEAQEAGSELLRGLGRKSYMTGDMKDLTDNEKQIAARTVDRREKAKEKYDNIHPDKNLNIEDVYSKGDLDVIDKAITKKNSINKINEDNRKRKKRKDQIRSAHRSAR